MIPKNRNRNPNLILYCVLRTPWLYSVCMAEPPCERMEPENWGKSIQPKLDQLMRANSPSGQSGTFRRRLDDDQGRGEPTKKEATKISYSSYKNQCYYWGWWLHSVMLEKLGQFGSGPWGGQEQGCIVQYVGEVGQVLIY